MQNVHYPWGNMYCAVSRIMFVVLGNLPYHAKYLIEISRNDYSTSLKHSEKMNMTFDGSAGPDINQLACCLPLTEDPVNALT